MYKNVSFYDFIDAFKLRPDNFSRDALDLLFQHFENYEEETGEKIELDVISICCDYSEMSLHNLRKYYVLSKEEYPSAESVIDFMKEETAVIGVIEFVDDDNNLDEEACTVVYLQF